MKKKFFVFIIALAIAVPIIAGCTEDDGGISGTWENSDIGRFTFSGSSYTLVAEVERTGWADEVEIYDISMKGFWPFVTEEEFINREYVRSLELL